MAESSDINGNAQAHEALRKLADSLERALDLATSVVLIRHSPTVCTVYFGDPSGTREELRKAETIPVELADQILELTASGSNRVQIGEQLYRFTRSFTEIEGVAAVVFAA
jgi:hypothetical protein